MIVEFLIVVVSCGFLTKMYDTGHQSIYTSRSTVQRTPHPPIMTPSLAQDFICAD